MAALSVYLRLEGCRSLKDKRQVVRGLLERLRRELHVAAAETGDQALWGNAEIGVACVSSAASHAESVLQHALDAIDANSSVEIVGVQRELYRL